MDSLVRSGFAPERAVHRRSMCPYGLRYTAGGSAQFVGGLFELTYTFNSLSFTAHAAPCNTHDT